MIRPDHRPDPAATFPVRFDLQPQRVEDLDKIIADGVGHRFEETPLVAEAVVVELERFELYTDPVVHIGAGHITHRHDTEVRVTRHRAHARELLGDVLNYKGRIGRRGEDFKER